MKFGINYNTGVVGVDPEAMIAIARHAEACGFESFYVPEHVASSTSSRPSPTGSRRADQPPSVPRSRAVKAVAVGAEWRGGSSSTAG